MDRRTKEAFVSSLRQELEASQLVIVTQQSGLTVDEVSKLRRQMREAGAEFKVSKNTLSRLAVVGTKNEALTSFLSGPTALAFSKDPIAAAKVSVAFASGNDKLKVIGGSLDGKALDVKDIETLAKLPSLDELRAKIIGVISTPATRVAGVIQAPTGQLARVFGAYSKSGS